MTESSALAQAAMNRDRVPSRVARALAAAAGHLGMCTVIVFGLTFLLALVLRFGWYRFALFPPDPPQLFNWIGSSYLLAFAVASLLRRRTWWAGLLAGILFLMLWAEIVRHATFLPDSRRAMVWLIFEVLAINNCIFHGAFVSCAGLRLGEHRDWLLLALLGVAAAGTVIQLRRLRTQETP